MIENIKPFATIQRIKNAVPVILLLFLATSVGLFFVNNSNSGLVGTDESLYVYLAKGQTVPTKEIQPPGSVIEVIKAGVARTGDPFGFFVLLHWWELVSCSEQWLRLLPFLFFCVSIIALIGIARVVGLPWIGSVCAGFLPIMSYYNNLYAIEFRAYGMEACCVTCLIFFGTAILVRMNSTQKIPLWLWVGLAFSSIAGLLARFACVMPIAAMYLTLVFFVLLLPAYRRLFGVWLAAAVATMIPFVISYFLRLQLAAYLADVSTVEYGMSGTFLMKVKILARQIPLLIPLLFGGAGILRMQDPMRMVIFSVIVLILFVCLLLILIRVVRGTLWQRIKSNNTLYSGVFGFCILTFVFAILLAWLNIHPFQVASRWFLYLQPVIAVGFLALITLLMQDMPCFKLQAKLSKELRIQHILLRFVIIIGTFIIGFYAVRFSDLKTNERGGGTHYTKELISEVLSDSQVKGVKWWYISVGEVYPFLFYYQYGNLRGCFSADPSIIFENINNRRIGMELDSIAENALSGDSIAMILGHTNEISRSKYEYAFLHKFPRGYSGRFLKNSQQLFIAVK